MSNWSLPEDVQTVSNERVGGSYVWESGVYKTTVKMVYLDQAKSGAVSFNVLLANAEGKELKEAMYIKSGDKKGNKTYYEKDGKSYPLPGYSSANSLCVAATGTSLPECLAKAETKTVKIYDFDQKREVPKERPVVLPLINTVITVAVSQIVENKRVQNDSGDYVPIADTKVFNECKFFGNSEGKSADEILKGSESEIFDKWAKKNTGEVIDKTSKSIAKPTTSASMFGKEDSATEQTPLFSEG